MGRVQHHPALHATRYVAQQLSVHKRPPEVRMVDALPRTRWARFSKKHLS
jgi:fatty acid CoA ligase FadD36